MADTKQLLRGTRERIAPPRDVMGGLERRRQRKDAARRASAAAVAVVVAVAALGGWFLSRGIESRTPAGGSDLGIFAPISGRIVYGTRTGIDAVDPVSGDVLELRDEPGRPIAWSADGRSLLIQQEIPAKAGADPGETKLEMVVLHADGTETVLEEAPSIWLTATLSPDGRTVVYARYPGEDGERGGLYRVDVESGAQELLLAAGEREISGLGTIETLISTPAFSPDGSQIAYVDGVGDHSNSVWIVDADGEGAQQIVYLAAFTPSGAAGHVFGLQWSPSGERLAIGIRDEPSSVLTFAPDGSDVRVAISNAIWPSWSPDGSQLSYGDEASAALYEATLRIANADGSAPISIPKSLPGPWHPGSHSGA